MLDELLAGLDLSPVTAEGNWRDRLVTVLRSYVRVLAEHPELAQSALVTRPAGPGYLNLVDGLLALLSVEVPAGQASWGVDLLLHFATSTAVEQGTRQRAVDARDEEDRLAQAIATASAAQYPHIAALGSDLLSGPGRLSWGFNVLMSGIQQTPRPAPGSA
jgi:hypothetical protein